MPRVVYSESVIPFQRLMRLVESDEVLMVQFHCKRLPESEDTLEYIIKVNEDMAQFSRSFSERILRLIWSRHHAVPLPFREGKWN